MKKTIFSKYLAGASRFVKTMTLALAAAVVAASCVADAAFESTTDNLFDEEDESLLVSVGLDVTSGDLMPADAVAATRMATRANDTSNEDNKIYDLWILQFDSGKNTKATRHIPNYTDEDDRIRRFYPGTDQIIVYVANTNDGTLFNRSMTYDEVMQTTYSASSMDKILASVNPDNVAPEDTDKVRFIMSQIKIGVTIAENSADDNKANLAATLQRNVAKIDIEYGVKAIGSGNKLSFTIASCQVDKVAQMNSQLAFNVVADKYTPPTVSTRADGDFLYPTNSSFYPYSSHTFDQSKLTNGVGTNTVTYYMPVNMRGTVAENKSWAEKYTAGLDIDNASFYTVTGSFDESVNNTTAASGKNYKLVFTEYLGTTATDYELKPNYYYYYSAIIPGDIYCETLENWAKPSTETGGKDETRFTWTANN